jgi:predicted GNAT family acetyltransferase
LNIINFCHLPEEQSYQLELEPGQFARLDYQREGDTLLLNHTIVPPELRGKNAAATLLEHALSDIEKQGLRISPVCSYVQSYLKRNPQWLHLTPNSQESIT